MFQKSIDTILKEDGKHWRKFFTKKGVLRSDTGSELEYSPSYADFYFAMTHLIGSEITKKYMTRIQFWILLESFLKHAFGIGAVTGLIAIIVTVLRLGDGGPEWMGTVATLLVMSPPFAYVTYLWFVKTSLNVYFENAYFKELAQKHNAVTMQKRHRKVNWVVLALLLGIVILGYLVTWEELATFGLMLLLFSIISLVEGIAMMVLVRGLRKFFARKSSTATLDLSDDIKELVIKRLKKVYMLLNQGAYEKGYHVFDTSPVSLADFRQSLRDCLEEHQKERLYLADFDQTSSEINFSEPVLSDDGQSVTFDVELFLLEEEDSELPAFYLICHAYVEGNQLTRLELIECDY